MAATLLNTFYSRGICSDLYYACYDQAGTNRYYYRKNYSNELFPDDAQVGDFVFIAMSAPFSGWEAVNLTPIGADSYTLAYKYWNGTSWVAFSGLTDGTNQFSQNGQITWTQPTDWETWAYDSNTESKSVRYAQYLFKIEITALSNWTEGGYLTGYQNVRQKYINVNDGGSHTPASLYSDDQSNGWGVITKKGDYAYDISCGVYFGSCTFTFNSTKIQIGDAGGPNYVPFKVYRATMLCNDSSTYMSDDLASALIVYSKGSEGTITFTPHVNSKFYNLYLACPYDTYYARFAISTYGGTGTVQAQWYNVLIGSMMYTIGSHYFNRINFQNIQYVLSAGDTVYDNCIFGTVFAKDPGYVPVFLRPTFDGGSSDTDDWTSGYYPDSLTVQQHMDIISAKWTKGNKWKCYADDAFPDSLQRSHIVCYSNFLNVKIQDKAGSAINGAKLSITDKHGNNALWEDLDVYFTNNFDDVNDTTVSVDDASGLNVDDEILWWGEVLKITNISGNDLTVSRGNESSARVFDTKDIYVPLRRRVPTMNIDGSKDELYIQERTYYKYTTDGGTTSTGNVYTDYAPLTLKVSKKGYKSFTVIIPFVEAADAINKSGEVFITAVMKLLKVNIDNEVIA